MAAAVVSAICLAWLLSGLDLGAVTAALRRAEPAPIALAFALALSLPFWRAARLRVLVPEGLAVPPGALTRIAAEVLLWSFLLPFKLGELTFPWLLRRRLGLARAEAVAVFLLVRCTDLAIIVGLGFLGLSLAGWAGTALSGWLLALLGWLALAAPVVVVLIADRWRRAPGLVGRLLAGAAHARDAWSRARLMATSLGLWGTHALIVWLALRAHALSLGIDWTLVIAAAGNLAFALPLPSVVGLGPQQVAFAMVAEAADVSPETAVAAALTTFGVVVGAALSAGLVARCRPVASSDRSIWR